ncbi:hypothetical protein TRIUR3_17901 [Triticum urartu]|uniref:Uncharacterized protein n=1 Tax=Triticum urartu TaxID=4572 RepID=M8ACH8_TRIUA|nr:hypothetical protein TRIUR3_17901 [Triticum urartu]
MAKACSQTSPHTLVVWDIRRSPHTGPSTFGAKAPKASTCATHGVFFDRRLHPSTPPQRRRSCRPAAQHHIHHHHNIEAARLQPGAISTLPISTCTKVEFNDTWRPRAEQMVFMYT